MRIAVLSDVHGNLPALEAVLKDVKGQGCDLVYHTGDVIAIGPWPAECFDLLMSLPNVSPVMGNHDAWYVSGLPDNRKMWRREEEVAHQHWVWATMKPTARDAMAKWPYLVGAVHEGVAMTFLHYPFDETGKDFAAIQRPPPRAWLDDVAGKYSSQLVFFGHDHSPHDVEGRARYIAPGAVGIVSEGETRYVVADCEKGRCRVQKRTVPYDSDALWKAFEDRMVPARELIIRGFFGMK